MSESVFKGLSERSKLVLSKIAIDKCISEAAGMPMPHDTGPFGNIMPKKKKKLKLVPTDIEEEKGFNKSSRKPSKHSFQRRECPHCGAEVQEGFDDICWNCQRYPDEEDGVAKTISLLWALKKLDSQGEEGINAGFGREEKSDDEKEEEEKAYKDESIYIPEDIKNEQGLVHKASYEHVAEGTSWTDETSPIDDSFYLPSKISTESNDTSKKAKKNQKDAKEAQKKYFGKVPDNPNDQGRARVKQNYNVGTIENAQIGGQGGIGGIGKSKGEIKMSLEHTKAGAEKQKIKKPVNIKQADKDFKPKDEYFVSQGGKKIEKTTERKKELTKPDKNNPFKPIEIPKYEELKGRKPTSGSVTPRRYVAQRPHKNKAIPTCANCGNELLAYDPGGNVMRDSRGYPVGANVSRMRECPHCGQNPSFKSKNTQEEESEQWALMHQRMLNAEQLQAKQKMIEEDLYRQAKLEAEKTGEDPVDIFKKLRIQALGKADYREDLGTMVSGVADIAEGISGLRRNKKKPKEKKAEEGKLKGLIERAKEKGKSRFKSMPIEEVWIKKAWEEYLMVKTNEEYENLVNSIAAEAFSSGTSFESAYNLLMGELFSAGLSTVSVAMFLAHFIERWSDLENKKKPSVVVEHIPEMRSTVNYVAPEKTTDDRMNRVLNSYREALAENPNLSRDSHGINRLHMFFTDEPITTKEAEEHNKKVDSIVQKNEDEDEEELLPANYPNSFYQKIWEELESRNKPRVLSAKKPYAVRRPKKEIENEQERLNRVMSITPEVPKFSREEVIRLSNALREVLGKHPWRQKTTRQTSMEDEKIKEQLGTLWEETGTKPMVEKEKLVKKNMIHLYGAPPEELPETESPPPILFKITEPVKKKEKP